MSRKQRNLGLANELDEMHKLQRLPTLQDYSDAYCREVIASCKGDVTLAASVLGVGRASLYRWVKRLQVPRDDSGDAQRREQIQVLFAATRGKW